MVSATVTAHPGCSTSNAHRSWVTYPWHHPPHTRALNLSWALFYGARTRNSRGSPSGGSAPRVRYASSCFENELPGNRLLCWIIRSTILINERSVGERGRQEEITPHSAFGSIIQAQDYDYSFPICGMIAWSGGSLIASITRQLQWSIHDTEWHWNG